MVFQFQILGFILLFLLVVFYYMECDQYKKRERGFKYLLLGTYLSQLVYICTYIAIQMDMYSNFYGKLYLVLVLGIYSGLGSYYTISWVKELYQNQVSVLKNILKKLKWGLIIVNGVSAILVLLSDVRIVFNSIRYQGSIFMILMIVYLIIGGVSLLFGTKKMTSKKCFHLWVIYLVSVVSFGLQYYFERLAIVNCGLVVMVIYLYLTLENLDKKELDVLRLERDYNARQNMDKVAFLKNISHEIRTPINAIDGFSQIILDSNDKKEIQDDVKDIRVASRDLIDVINGMIDLSIIESGNLEIIEENYNVYDMFDGVMDIVHSKLRDRHVSLEVNIDPDIPEVLFGDSERISQVILNVFKNSIKYTDQGNITLVVESVKSKTMCRLKIQIEDTGRGMTEEEVQKIFFRDNGENSNGIGLLISKYLIDLMNGSLELKSTYGEGTIVTITIDQKIISEKQVEKNSHKRVFKPFQADNKRILIVDDNKLNLKVASRLLEPYGVEVVEANSGQECLDLLERDIGFDLILMDDLMPEMSGSETMNVLKKIQRVDGYYIPVVVLTANAISGQKEKYLEMGFEDYLSKPIDRYELDRVLRKFLKGKK